MRWYIALRYLLSHKRQTLVCIAGVIISVMMFITMDAMMEGFKDKFIVETVESSGHITVHDEPRETRTKILERIYTDPNAILAVSNVKPREDVKKIKNAEGLMRELRHLRGIVAAAPEVDGDAIATYGTKTLTVSVLGIDPEEQQKVTTIGKDIVEGSFTRLHGTADGVVLGRGVSDLLGAKLDDEITLTGTEGGRTTSRIVGIFDTGVTPVDYSALTCSSTAPRRSSTGRTSSTTSLSAPTITPRAGLRRADRIDRGVQNRKLAREQRQLP